MKSFKFYVKKYSYKTAETTDVSFIPAMTRRKLSQLDKTSLCVLNDCFIYNHLKLVFASQYGELDRLKKLVNQYTNENEVSPTTFSSSVHNAAIGKFSLLNSINESYNSISAEQNTFIAGLIEAMLTSQSGDVLYCYCDSNDTTQGFACVISAQNSDKTNSFEMKISLHPSKTININNDLQNFLNLLEHKSDNFISQNGRLQIFRSK